MLTGTDLSIQLNTTFKHKDLLLMSIYQRLRKKQGVYKLKIVENALIFKPLIKLLT